VTVPAPELVNVSPTSGDVGSKVTITGTALEGATSVTVNGVTAPIIKDQATKLKITVPTGATTGEIAVTTPSGTTLSATDFTVT
jgi:hypothetical protein